MPRARGGILETRSTGALAAASAAAPTSSGAAQSVDAGRLVLSVRRLVEAE